MIDALEVRELRDDDWEAAWQLGRLAFGSPPEPPPHSSAEIPGMTRYGAFAADGRLVGKAVDLHHEQWWYGRRVAAADVAGVAVLPEARGRGVARALLGELLAGARARGAAVSALYPTVAAPYRAAGWEICGALRTVDVPAVGLRRYRPAPQLSVRPGGIADMPAVADLYERVVRHRCGLLTRQGPLYDHFTSTTELPDGLDGVTLVSDGGQLLGYASWERGRGYDASAVLTVPDLLASTPEAAQELLGVLASWHSVAPTLRLCLLAHDAVAAYLPLESARVQEQRVWMHRPVDVVRAVQTRGWPQHARGTVEFRLRDEVAPWNAGAWRLEVADGSARLEPISGEPELTLTVPGFALLYTGAATAVTVSQAGLLRCAGGADPSRLDLLGAGPRAELLDYF